ncbi:hypothetical protein SCUP515_03093 [Seiridium cupressi]
MISDDDLYRLAIFLGSIAMVLIVLYHFFEVNSSDSALAEKASAAKPVQQAPAVGKSACPPDATTHFPKWLASPIFCLRLPSSAFRDVLSPSLLRLPTASAFNHFLDFSTKSTSPTSLPPIIFSVRVLTRRFFASIHFSGISQLASPLQPVTPRES